MTYILIFITALCNAIMDVLADRFESSIFSKLNPHFWKKSESYLNKYIDRDKSKGRKYPSYLSGFTDTFSDAWHIAKIIVIFTIVLGFSLTKTFTMYEILIHLGIWGITFKLFYSKLLIRK